jgi:hypothetical protein
MVVLLLVPGLVLSTPVSGFAFLVSGSKAGIITRYEERETCLPAGMARNVMFRSQALAEPQVIGAIDPLGGEEKKAQLDKGLCQVKPPVGFTIERLDLSKRLTRKDQKAKQDINRVLDLSDGIYDDNWTPRQRRDLYKEWQKHPDRYWIWVARDERKEIQAFLCIEIDEKFAKADIAELYVEPAFRNTLPGQPFDNPLGIRLLRIAAQSLSKLPTLQIIVSYTVKTPGLAGTKLLSQQLIPEFELVDDGRGILRWNRKTPATPEPSLAQVMRQVLDPDSMLSGAHRKPSWDGAELLKELNSQDQIVSGVKNIDEYLSQAYNSGLSTDNRLARNAYYDAFYRLCSFPAHLSRQKAEALLLSIGRRIALFNEVMGINIPQSTPKYTKPKRLVPAHTYLARESWMRWPSATKPIVVYMVGIGEGGAPTLYDFEKELRKAGFRRIHIIGIDSTPKIIQEAKSKLRHRRISEGTQIDFVCLDDFDVGVLRQLGFPAPDLIESSNVVRHYKGAEGAAAIVRMARSLKRDSPVGWLAVCREDMAGSSPIWPVQIYDRMVQLIEKMEIRRYKNSGGGYTYGFRRKRLHDPYPYPGLLMNENSQGEGGHTIVVSQRLMEYLRTRIAQLASKYLPTSSEEQWLYRYAMRWLKTKDALLRTELAVDIGFGFNYNPTMTLVEMGFDCALAIDNYFGNFKPVPDGYPSIHPMEADALQLALPTSCADLLLFHQAIYWIANYNFLNTIRPNWKKDNWQFSDRMVRKWIKLAEPALIEAFRVLKPGQTIAIRTGSDMKDNYRSLEGPKLIRRLRRVGFVDIDAIWEDEAKRNPTSKRGDAVFITARKPMVTPHKNHALRAAV